MYVIIVTVVVVLIHLSTMPFLTTSFEVFEEVRKEDRKIPGCIIEANCGSKHTSKYVALCLTLNQSSKFTVETVKLLSH